MASFDFETTGIRAQLEGLKEERRDWTGGPTYYVGTAVEYSVTPMPSENRTNSGKRYVAS